MVQVTIVHQHRHQIRIAGVHVAAPQLARADLAVVAGHEVGRNADLRGAHGTKLSSLNNSNGAPQVLSKMEYLGHAGPTLTSTLCGFPPSDVRYSLSSLRGSPSLYMITGSRGPAGSDVDRVSEVMTEGHRTASGSAGGVAQ